MCQGTAAVAGAKDELNCAPSNAVGRRCGAEEYDVVRRKWGMQGVSVSYTTGSHLAR